LPSSFLDFNNGISKSLALADCSSIFDVYERTIRRWLEGGNDLAQTVSAPLRKRGPKRAYVVKKEHIRGIDDHMKEADNYTKFLDEVLDAVNEQFNVRYTVQQLSAALLHDQTAQPC
jgi:hypothetical protein